MNSIIAAPIVVVGIILGLVSSGTAIGTNQAAALDADEAASIIFVREEEKLARDVYVVLGERWGLTIFSNIAASEQRHMDAAALLVEQYDLIDPVGDNPAGVFVDPELQQLYDELVKKGLTSMDAALEVGGYIEEYDLVDLAERIEATDEVAIQQVFDQLERGSRNHLRAFARTTERLTGIAYAPQVLEAEQLAEVLSSGIEHGGRGR